MICVICRQADVVGENIAIPFERGEMKCVVRGVPAGVCPYCREAYVDEDIAVRLLQVVEEMYATGMIDDVWEFDPS